MTGKPGWTGASMLFVFAALTSCGGGGGGGGSTQPSASSVTVIGPAGGTATGPDGVTVVIPPGAVNQPTAIGIARSSAGAPATPEAYPAAGYVYELTPHGITFNSLVTVRAPMPAGATAPLVFMASQGEGWKQLDAQVVNGMAEWQRNSFSNLLMGTACFVPVAMNSDPYWCAHESSYATVAATPTAAMVQTGSIDQIRGDMGNRRMDQAATLRFTTYFAVPGNDSNVSVELRRFTYVGSATRTWSLPIIVQTKIPTLTVDGGVLRGVETFDFPFDHTLPVRNRFALVVKYDYPGVAHASGNSTVTGWDYGNYQSSSIGDGLEVTSNVPVPTAFFTVGGAVSGLTGTGLVLQNNGTDFTPVAADGNFTFATSIGGGVPYNVTVLTQPAGQTCTVTNGSGTANAVVTNVAVSCVVTYPIGGTVSGLVGAGLVLQNNGADNLTFTVSGAFTFATQAVAGSAYSVTVLAQPSGSNCTVQNGSGTANAAVTNVVVTCTSAGPLALVANSSSNTLSIFRVDSTTGGLTSTGATIATGQFPFSVAITPNGQYAYVGNLVGGSISAYSIDNVTGVLTPISSRVSQNPYGMAMDPLGRFVYVANYGFHTVSSFAIAPDGALTATGAPLATGALPYAIAAHPGGNFVYVASELAHTVSVYGVNPASGVLTLVPGTIANSVFSPRGIAISPNGSYAYVADSGGSSVAAFRINAGTGALTVIGYTNTGTSANSIVVHPNGQYAYVTVGSNNVVVFSIDPVTGALTAAGSPVATGVNPHTVAVNSAGTYLYVTNNSNNSVSAFSISAGGATLTSLGATVPTGTAPEGIAVTP